MKERYNKFFNNYSFNSLYNSSISLLSEDIIIPEEYLENIEDKINKLLQLLNKKKNLNVLCGKLNLLFISNRIRFFNNGNISKGNEEYIYFGINEGKTISDGHGTIGIFLNDNVLNIFVDNNFFKKFMLWLLFIIKHELIHRGQQLKLKDIQIYGSGEDWNLKKILSTPYETMARAWESVELLKLQGFDINRIKKLIASTDFIKKRICYTIEAYHRYFDNENNLDRKILKLFYKYMYMYLDQK